MGSRSFQPWLWQLSLFSLLALSALLGSLLMAIDSASRKSVSETSRLLVGVDQTSRQVDLRVRKFLAEAREILEGTALDVKRSGPAAALETRMFNHGDIAEISFTWGSIGQEQTVLRNSMGQVVARTTRPLSRGVTAVGKSKFEVVETTLGTHAQRSLGEAPDPRLHPTFDVLQRPKNLGLARWSDLHFSQVDDRLPVAKRRVELSVQMAVLQHGKSLGVARVGRWTDQLDHVGDDRSDGKRIFLCDTSGQLLTRLEPGDPVHEGEEDLRIRPTHEPEEIKKALVDLKKHQLTPVDPDYVVRINLGDESFIASFRLLPEPEDWVVGVIIPEKVLLQPLLDARMRLSAIAVLTLLGAVAFVALLLYGLHRDQRRLLETTARMRDLDFSAGGGAMTVRDNQEIANSLEGAKATLRAFSKYVPVDLVRLLFQRNLEPQLGAGPRRITMLFTDVAGFTSEAEKLGVAELAERLGTYLDRLSAPIHISGGSILERIGDALLVIWNAPAQIADHPRRACLTALACQEASEELGWHTRFGIHTDDVMVGHFGSHERMNYGVLGDGVNLASRIEGLNKHYGTSILLSRSVAEAVPDGLELRLIDRVAVKGRAQGIELYELMGETGKVSEAALVIGERYEQAFRLYLEGRFSEAGVLFAAMPDDPPSRTLAKRCAEYALQPPPPSWGGVFVATFK